MAASSELALSSATLPTALGQASKRMRTVVVDDSETFLKVICHLLDLENLIDLVAAACDGVEAIDTVIRLKPALVVMDVCMPGLDGLSAASLLAEMSPAPAVILMSSDDSPQLRAACERAGAFAFVHKENFRQEFEAVLERVAQARDAQWVRETA
ncbi:MAG TPA: response regulator [Candidatus Angelobacter sp.]